jgi:hypothetical protein
MIEPGGCQHDFGKAWLVLVARGSIGPPVRHRLIQSAPVNAELREEAKGIALPFDVAKVRNLKAISLH